MDFDYSEYHQGNDKRVSEKKPKFNGLIIALIITIGIGAFFAGAYLTNIDSNQISEKELEEAITKLELKILQKELPTNQPQIEIKISADNDPLIGYPNAPITIIEFSDFQCPFCAKFNTQTFPLIYEEYIKQGKVNLVFRDFPIQSIHPNAVAASVAAECAHEQGKFMDMHDILFNNQNNWNKLQTVNAVSQFSKYATQIQLNQEIFDSCLTNGKYIEEIKKDLNDGRDYGISGTPGFFIGNDKIGYVSLVGAQPFDSFKKVIDSQLSR